MQTFVDKVDSIEYNRAIYHGGRHLNLPNLLQTFRSRLSTDPRDKIFGLLGLVTKNPKYRALRANYMLSVEAAYQEAFTHLLQETGDINLLVRPNEAKRKPDLPTWIPDWTANIDEFDFNLESLIRITSNLYNASRSTKSHIRYPIMTTTLRLKGLLFDEVATLTEPFRKVFSRVNIIEYLQVLLNWMERQPQLYIVGGDLVYTLMRLVSMDQVMVDSDDSIREIAQRATIEDYRKYQNSLASFVDDLKTISIFIRCLQVFTSRKGYIGLGPKNTRVGDTVHVFLGGNVPFMLRQITQQTSTVTQEKNYEFLGNCYVQGIMDGEALDGVDVNELDWVNLV
ncbi:hypothetical protein N0V90_003445 [Kalmusia sp. IMI 367209]|nr:hypothetical protein N0V90_003445 [Kalmusia sp. IMI 367209]